MAKKSGFTPILTVLGSCVMLDHCPTEFYLNLISDQPFGISWFEIVKFVEFSEFSNMYQGSLSFGNILLSQNFH